MDSIQAGAHRLDDSTTIYVCDCDACLRKTGGWNTQVLKATYFRHKPIRLAASILLPLNAVWTIYYGLAITPARYAELIKTHLPPLSFPLSCDPSGSHQYYFIHGDAPDPNHNSLLSQSSSLQSLLNDQDPTMPADSDNLVVELKCQLMELQHTVASLQADLLRVTSEKTSLLSTCQALQNIIVNIRSSASSVASSSSASPPSDTSNTTDERKPSCLLDGMIEDITPFNINQRIGVQLVSPPLPSHNGTTPDHEPTPPPQMDKGKEKEVVAVEVKNPLSNLVLKPRPRPVSQKPPSPSIVSSSSGSNPAVVPPSTNITPISRPEISSSSDSASLAVKMELIGVTHTKQTKPTINSKPDAIKKQQPSTKPMRISPKITAWNLCTLEWQSNGNQKEPASVFATYWNGLPTADKELYKHKVSVQDWFKWTTTTMTRGHMAEWRDGLNRSRIISIYVYLPHSCRFSLGLKVQQFSLTKYKFHRWVLETVAQLFD
ncbi:hypothetical protein BDR06DRAFT_968971 [Suillus hirtellus]|nr:hypothetical protein BDR06DRAFT_968971 [Suillus hirtellus]